MAKRKSPASEFLEDILPHAVSTSMARRMHAKRAGAEQPGETAGQHASPAGASAGDSAHGPERHSDEEEEEAPELQHEEPGIGAEGDAQARPRQRMPSESRDRAAAARMHTPPLKMGGRHGDHPQAPPEEPNDDVTRHMSEDMGPESEHQSDAETKKNRYPPKQFGRR